MVATFPGPHTGFIPNSNATNNLMVDFSRNVGDFAVNRYAQIVPVTKTIGVYWRMTLEERARILNDDGAEFLWADDAPAPNDRDGTESYDTDEYRTSRYKFGWMMGQKTIDQHDFDIVAGHGEMKAQQAMTFRTLRVVKTFTTVANHQSDHVLDVTDSNDVPGVSGQSWILSTTARQDIKRSINQGLDKISLDTNDAVKPDQIHLVLSKALARDLSVSQEIVDYIKQSPDAWAYVKGELADQNRNQAYGLPPKLYGVNLEIEGTVRVTSRKGAATTRQRVLPAATPFMCSRVGELEGRYGGPSFSSVSQFILEEMTVETKYDPDDRLTYGRVVEDYDVEMTAPVSTILFQNAA